MSGTRRLIERVGERFTFPDDAFDRMLARRERKQRNEKVRVFALAAAIAVAGGVAILSQSRSAHVPADEPPGPATGGGRIAFVSGIDERLYSVAPDGSDLRQVGDVRVEYPDWSPDGSMIAFDDGTVIDHPDWSDESGHIYTMTADGADVVQITGGNGAEFAPDWSPDGSRLAVTAIVGGGTPAGIFIVDPASGDMQRVTTNPFAGYLDKEPDYSPDGAQIVFVRDRELRDAGAPRDRSALFVVNVDGTGLRRLTSWDKGLAGTPSWSPDGTMVVYRGDFAFGTSDQPSQIFVIPSDGGEPRQLTTETDANSYWPSWSPDGRRIVFTRFTYGSSSQRLYTMRLDGSRVTRLAIPAGNEATWWGDA